MSKKSRKIKKFKSQTFILKASEIESYILQKYEIKDFNFWKWFFKNCSIGSTSILILDAEKTSVPFESIQYFFIIKDEFLSDANDDKCLEIENDLSSYDC